MVGDGKTRFPYERPPAVRLRMMDLGSSAPATTLVTSATYSGSKQTIFATSNRSSVVYTWYAPTIDAASVYVAPIP